MAEQYEGVKFTPRLAPGRVQDHRLQELKYWGRVFHRHGLAPLHEAGSSGNLSARLRPGSDAFIVTATGVRSKDALTDNDFALVESCDLASGVVVARGRREPSSESMMHWAIYKERPEVHAVFHGHCDDIVLQACKLQVPKTQAEEHYGTVDQVRRVLEILGGAGFVVLRGHGFVSVGRTLTEAGQRALTAYGRSQTLRDIKRF